MLARAPQQRHDIDSAFYTRNSRCLARIIGLNDERAAGELASNDNTVSRPAFPDHAALIILRNSITTIVVTRTSIVRSRFGNTVGDNTGDEEFCGRRPRQLEQSASCPSNRNALASGVRSTSQDAPVRLGLTD